MKVRNFGVICPVGAKFLFISGIFLLQDVPFECKMLSETVD